jgi:hypothetical protein
MARLLGVSLPAVVLLALAPAVRAADEPQDIIAKAIKAHGGEDFLTKNKAAQLKAKGKITIPGLGETDFTQETAYMLPDKFKESIDLSVGGQNVNILTLANGDKVTIEANGKEVDVPDAAKTALKGATYMLKVARLVPLLKEKGFELSLIGDDKVEGKKVVGVRVSKKDQKDISLFFDKDTGLIAKLEYRGADPSNGMEVNEERIITEYMKNKDGIPTAKKVVVKHDGKTFLDAEVIEATFLEKLDDSVFKK